MSINTSIGTPTADSYVSVAYANTYFNAREFSDQWTNILTNSTGTLSATIRKERLLKQATREIDRAYRFQEAKYYGGDVNATDYQILEFPRSSNIDANNDLYIPDEVKDATCEQALWIMERGGKRTNDAGLVIEKQMIGDEAVRYLRHWVTRNVQPYGDYEWQGSKY